MKSLEKKIIKAESLFLTAKDSLEDVVNGLDSGADDYLIKPFKFEELAARIKGSIAKDGETF